MTTTPSTKFPHLVVETDSESDEEDSFFDLELTLHDSGNKENNNVTNKTDQDPHNQTSTQTKVPCSKHELTSKTSKSADDSEVDVPSISKRKVLPIEPISKPQSPIALLKSAPSFRIFMFKKHKRMATEKKAEEPVKTGCNTGKKKETKVFALKLSVEEFQSCSSTPTLSRVGSSRSFGSKIRSNGSEEPKTERFSKEALQRYLKLLKPLYVRVSKRYGEKVRFSGEGSTTSPSSSPSVASVSSRKERLGGGGFPAGMRGVSRQLGKSRSSPAVVGVGSPVNRSDDTLLQQHDGIQSAILHCKRSLNSRGNFIYLSHYLVGL